MNPNNPTTLLSKHTANIVQTLPFSFISKSSTKTHSSLLTQTAISVYIDFKTKPNTNKSHSTNCTSTPT